MQTATKKLNQSLGVTILPLKNREDFSSRIEYRVRNVQGKATNAVKKHQPYSLIETSNYSELFVYLRHNSLHERDISILGLYQILTNHPDFKDDLPITEDNTESEIINILINEIVKLVPEDYEYEISIYQNRDLSIFFYTNLSVSESQSSIPVKWISNYRNNKPFYDALTCCISLIYREFHICLWDDGFDSIVLEYLNSDDIEDYEVKEANDYYKGSELIYGAIKKKHTMRMLKGRYKKLNPKNKIEKSIQKWIKQGIDLIENYNEFSLHDLIYISEYENENGTPICPSDYYKFVWDFEHDFWSNHIEYLLNDTAANYGVAPPRVYSVLSSDEYKHSDYKQVEDFGNALSSWFQRGQHISYKV